jgi:uncharacterized membrane protein
MSSQSDQSPSGANASAKDNGIEILRINRAFQLAVFGLALAAFLVGMLLLACMTSDEIVSIVGLFTSVLGTLVGAFFGLQIGSAGREKAENRADNAQKKVDALQSAADEATINKARDLYKGLFT